MSAYSLKRRTRLRSKGKPRASWRTKGGRHALPGKLAWIRLQGCDLCHAWPAEAHHDRHLGSRAEDRKVVPLCASHHREGPESVQALGRSGFQARHGYDLEARTAYWQTRWEQEEG